MDIWKDGALYVELLQMQGGAWLCMGAHVMFTGSELLSAAFCETNGASRNVPVVENMEFCDDPFYLCRFGRSAVRSPSLCSP